MNQVVKIQSKTINNLFYTVQKRKVAPCTEWITFLYGSIWFLIPAWWLVVTYHMLHMTTGRRHK